MKKTLRALLLLFAASLVSNPIVSAADAVPEHYYANHKFISDWNQIWEIFKSMKSRSDL